MKNTKKSIIFFKLKFSFFFKIIKYLYKKNLRNLKNKKKKKKKIVSIKKLFSVHYFLLLIESVI
jgi:uncharacterized membrane protein